MNAIKVRASSSIWLTRNVISVAISVANSLTISITNFFTNLAMANGL